MNNRRTLYYPAVAYLLLLVCVWLFSWLVGVVDLLRVAHSGILSLVSAEGVRWALRSASQSVNSAPWAAIMLFTASLGLLAGSGLVKSARGVLRGASLTFVERRAWSMAAIAFVLYLLLLFVCTVYPWNILLGVTGDFYTSTIVQGRGILSFAGVLFVAVAFGFIYGNYRSLIDVLRSVGAAFSRFSPALIAVLPASGIMPCASYSGALTLLEITPQDAAVLADILYLLPFVYIMFVVRNDGRERR